MAAARQPGRLSDPTMTLRTEPRLKPRLLEALAAYGLDGPAAPAPVDRDVAHDALVDAVRQGHDGFEGLYEAMPNDLPGDESDGVVVTSETIRGADGNPVELRVYRPADATGPLPGVLYLHGGGMTILSSFNKVHTRWCRDLATTGMVAIGVDFRNAYTSEGLNPFPAGLDDCSRALAWVHAHRQQLGLSSLVVEGESGGANLTLATTLKAKRDDRLDSIDGVYAVTPFISGGYVWDEARKLTELPSMIENDDYFLNGGAMDLNVAVYDPDGSHAEDPLCWPLFADVSDLTGLPPHVITVDELDPLRDEGVAYYRKLVAAGVPVTGRVNLGLTHAAELIFRKALPEEYFATVRDIHRFAAAL